MQHRTATITLSTVSLLDTAAQALARALGKVTRITGAGAFWITGGQSFWDAWTEEAHGGGASLTVRLGRLELIADWDA